MLGGAGADTLINAGLNAQIIGGADNDFISISGSNNLIQYTAGDGNDSVVGFNTTSTLKIGNGTTDTYSTVKSSTGNDIIVTAGSGNVTLNGAATLSTVNIQGKEIKSTPTPIISQQDVIKKFMGSLDTTSASGEDALNQAVSVASGGYFTSIQQATNAMVKDCSISGSDTFLLDKCGINLKNDDTGAITGYDAGGSTYEKTATSIVPESGSLINFTGNSFTTNGLTFYLSDVSDINNISKINYSSLENDAQRYIWKSLYTWWSSESLKLIAQSYGNNFGFTSNSSATVKEVYFGFVNNPSSTALATTWSSLGKTGRELDITVNMKYYNNISTSDPNGYSDLTSVYLDRTIAHEFTHAVMSANINYFHDLPDFILEGMAELTHGIDDKRTSTIIDLAKDYSKLKNAVDLNNTGVSAYSGGYMFLRYLAKQGSEHYGESLSAKMMSAETSSVSVSGNMVSLGSNFNSEMIDLTKYASNIRKLDASKITKGIKIIGNTYANSIKAGSGADTISGNTGDDTIYGGAGNDIIKGDAGKDILYGDAGNDTLFGGNSTLTGGAGRDVFVYSYGSDFITDYTAGQDKIKLTEDSILGASISGSNVILALESGSITVKNGKNKNITVIDKDGKETTKKYSKTTVSSISTGNVSISHSVLFEDNNFLTDDAQIESVKEISANNYSVGDFEDFNNDKVLTQNETLTAASYSYADK